MKRHYDDFDANGDYIGDKVDMDEPDGFGVIIWAVISCAVFVVTLIVLITLRQGG